MLLRPCRNVKTCSNYAILILKILAQTHAHKNKDDQDFLFRRQLCDGKNKELLKTKSFVFRDRQHELVFVRFLILNA